MSNGVQRVTPQQQQQQQAIEAYKERVTLLNKPDVIAQIARALPKHITPERMIRVATTALQRTPKLLTCEARSIVAAVVQASEMGLEPNTPLSHGWLIPYWNSNTKRQEAQFQVGYRGLIELARRSGEIASISAEVVKANDHFEIEWGTDRKLVHRPPVDFNNRGDKLGVYAVVVFKDGTKDFEFMTADQVEAIRKRSKSPDSGPWVTDTEEMWRKTPIRKLSKRLPLSTENPESLRFLQAVAADEENDLDFGGVAGDIFETPEPEKITEEQRIALVELAKEHGVSDKLTEIVRQYGFAMLAEITADAFPRLTATVIDEGQKLKATSPTETEAAPAGSEQSTAAPAKGKIKKSPAPPPDFENLKPGDKVDFSGAEGGLFGDGLTDLRIAINDGLVDKFGKDAQAMADFMGGRNVNDIKDADELRSLHEKLLSV